MTENFYLRIYTYVCVMECLSRTGDVIKYMYNVFTLLCLIPVFLLFAIRTTWGRAETGRLKFLGMPVLPIETLSQQGFSFKHLNHPRLTSLLYITDSPPFSLSKVSVIQGQAQSKNTQGKNPRKKKLPIKATSKL